jgi:Fic-DOC domain mobile mystery protein B
LIGPAFGAMSSYGVNNWNGPGPAGSTPLDLDETEDLIPAWVATRGDLNEAEQRNILKATRRLRWRRCSVEHLLHDQAARDLHRDMFGDVWKWAGRYRSTEKNIGVEPMPTSVRVRDLMADAGMWLSTSMSLDEIGYEFHHKLVHVHPFPNGNGRHARQMTDILMRALGQPPFTWGSVSLDDDGKTRDVYIAALRAADHGDDNNCIVRLRSSRSSLGPI